MLISTAQMVTSSSYSDRRDGPPVQQAHAVSPPGPPPEPPTYAPSGICRMEKLFDIDEDDDRISVVLRMEVRGDVGLPAEHSRGGAVREAPLRARARVVDYRESCVRGVA